MSTEYLQPKSWGELKEDLQRLTEKSVILAGGTDLMPKIQVRKKEPDLYLSLCRMEELKAIDRQGEWLKIGAMAAHTQASEDPFVGKYFTALAMACSQVRTPADTQQGNAGRQSGKCLTCR